MDSTAVFTAPILTRSAGPSIRPSGCAAGAMFRRQQLIVRKAPTIGPRHDLPDSLQAPDPPRQCCVALRAALVD